MPEPRDLPGAHFDEYSSFCSSILEHRQAIVERIEARLLNVRDKPIARAPDRRMLGKELRACFLQAPGMPPSMAGLDEALANDVALDGFGVAEAETFAYELDPPGLLIRSYEIWRQGRWPGRNGRLAWAETLYVVFVLRRLERLTMRVWDGGGENAGSRLREIQGLLDRLNAGAMPREFVRDVRWLVQTAQGLFSTDYAPYFRWAARVDALPHDDRLATHDTGARILGGHLRSQWRFAMLRMDRDIDDPELTAVQRNSNALDHGLLLRDLATLLESYGEAGTAERRLALADAILQGMSVDPELFVTRLDLLASYIVAEDLWVTEDEGGRRMRTPLAADMLATFERYRSALGEQIGKLREDATRFDPRGVSYSPFALVYGFTSDLITNMALASLTASSPQVLGIEELFASLARLEEKRACVAAWLRLPKGPGEQAELNGEFAGEVYGRLLRALGARARRPSELNASGSPDVRLVATSWNASPARRDLEGALLGNRFVLTTDLQRAAEARGTPHRPEKFLRERLDGGFLASAEVDGGWVGVSKLVLTATAAMGGGPVLLGELPEPLIETLRLTCPHLLDEG